MDHMTNSAYNSGKPPTNIFPIEQVMDLTLLVILALWEGIQFFFSFFNKTESVPAM